MKTDGTEGPATFRFPGGLAGRARGLTKPGAAATRALEIVAAIEAKPKQLLTPRVHLVQLLDFMTIARRYREGTNAPPVPDEVVSALTTVLGVASHARRQKAVASHLPAREVAALLGVTERTVRRDRATGTLAASRNPLVLVDRPWSGYGHPPGTLEGLFDIAMAEIARGTYFSADLLWALAEVLGVASRGAGLAQSAVEVVSAGLRQPDKFIKMSLVEDGMSTNALAKYTGTDTTTVDRWRNDPKLATALALNRLNKAAFERFNARPRRPKP